MVRHGRRGWPIGVAGALTIGILVLPFAVVAVVVLATRRGSGDGIGGLVSGLGVPLLLVAVLQPSTGPGNVCRIGPDSSSCTQEWNPWPWLAVGLVLLAGGVVIFVRSSRPPIASRVPAAEARGRNGRATAQSFARLSSACLEVGDEVGLRLDADREAHEARVDLERRARGRGVGHARRDAR